MSPDILDFERLVAPIPGDNPAGAALREDFSPDSIYHRIKDARGAARAAERSLLFEDDAGAAAQNRADWQPVYDLGIEAIAERSKDVEIAAWLVEALVREEGYVGLRDGFRLVRQLVEQFWDQLYPLPDEDGILTRVAPLAGLNGEEAEGVLIAPIARVPITAVAEDRAMTLADYREALDLDRLADTDRRAQRIAQGAVSMEAFGRAVRATSAEQFSNLLEDLGQCAEEFDKLSAVLEEKCGRGPDGYPLAPPSSSIRSALATARDELQHLSKDVLAAAGIGEAGDGQPGGALVAAGAPGSLAAGRVQTREDAFRALLHVADFFKRTEPHSPVAYALEQAVRWGRMPLPELLTELIPEAAVREQLFKLVGIKPTEPRGEGTS